MLQMYSKSGTALTALTATTGRIPALLAFGEPHLRFSVFGGHCFPCFHPYSHLSFAFVFDLPVGL
jgi:hypothetical protein